jgi:hypothetical protein
MLLTGRQRSTSWLCHKGNARMTVSDSVSVGGRGETVEDNFRPPGGL